MFIFGPQHLKEIVLILQMLVVLSDWMKGLAIHIKASTWGLYYARLYHALINMIQRRPWPLGSMDFESNGFIHICSAICVLKQISVMFCVHLGNFGESNRLMISIVKY